MAITSKDIAVAAEAINRHPNLSPVARRVGLELLNRLNRDTKRPGYGCAWPSKDRLAAALGVSVRSIWRGVNELFRAGLVERARRRGRKTNVYTFVWRNLKATATRIKTHLKTLAVQFRRNDANAAQANATKQQKPSNRPEMSDNPSQFQSTNSINQFSRFRDASKPSHTNPAIIEQRASARLYAALSGLPRHAFASILACMSPDMEQQAITAERFRPGTGLETLLALLKGVAVAMPHNPQPAAQGGTL